MRSKVWTVATALVAAIFLAVAVSHEVYEITSPIALSWHVFLRKGYSIGAFAIVGFLARGALVENDRRANAAVTCTIGVAAYSGAIELAQFLHGSHEGLGWNAFDVGCGALGGAIGALASRAIRNRVLAEPYRETKR